MDPQNLPKRRPNRIPGFDYSTPGAYFITICTANRAPIFWDAAETASLCAAIDRPHTPRLSSSGRIVDAAIRSIPSHYPAISVDHYVVMPNHIHLLLQINTDDDGRAMLAPTISVVVQQLKGVVTKQLGHSVWQKLFHDHVIRNEADYLKIWQYIDGNPSKWEDDCFYIPIP